MHMEQEIFDYICAEYCSEKDYLQENWNTIFGKNLDDGPALLVRKMTLAANRF